MRKPPHAVIVVTAFLLLAIPLAFWMPKYSDSKHRHQCARLGATLGAQTRYAQGSCWIKKTTGWEKT